MREEILTDALLREFLLGKVSDDDRERIENLFLTDSQAHERVLAAEQDLIEDYLEESLTSADEERFVSLYAQTDEQRRKLRITKSIIDWAVAEAPVIQPPVNASFWSRLRGWLRANPMVVPVTATIMIAIVVVAAWLASRTGRQSAAIEQELAQLNTPASLRQALPNMVSKDLWPVATRSGEQQVEINRAGIQYVELRLPWVQTERFSKYEATLLRDGKEDLTIHDLEPPGDGPIRIRVTTQMLHRGQYRIELCGIAADGTAGPPEEYVFLVNE